MAKVGRPKTENSKTRNVGFRMSEAEYQELKARSAEHSLSITQTINQGIAMVYESWEKDGTKSLS